MYLIIWVKLTIFIMIMWLSEVLCPLQIKFQTVSQSDSFHVQVFELFKLFIFSIRILHKTDLHDLWPLELWFFNPHLPFQRFESVFKEKSQALVNLLWLNIQTATQISLKINKTISLPKTLEITKNNCAYKMFQLIHFLGMNSILKPSASIKWC